MAALCDGCDAKLAAGETLPAFCVPCTARKHVTPQRRLYIILLTSGEVANHAGLPEVRDLMYGILAGKLTGAKLHVKRRKREEKDERVHRETES